MRTVLKYVFWSRNYINNVITAYEELGKFVITYITTSSWFTINCTGTVLRYYLIKSFRRYFNLECVIMF
jgi:hypothetical protein